jgi:hypothetical protein
MSDPFSEYVTLLSDVGEIAVAARESASLSSEQRAATMARVLELVRNRVLPQSEREEAGRAALFDDRAAGLPRDHAVTGPTDHQAILAPVDELAHVDPHDGARVQELLYRLHAAIAGHFGDAELIFASTVVEKPPGTHRRSIDASADSPSDTGGRKHIGPSHWFG